MIKKHIYLLTFFAIVSVSFSGYITFKIFDDSINYHNKTNAILKAIKQSKIITSNLQENVEKTYKNNIVSKRNINSYIKSLIDEINFENYKIKTFAFNQLGFYIAHYLNSYEGSNAFLEKDINNSHYIKNIVKNMTISGSYEQVRVIWSDNSIKNLITFIKKDENLNIYYGCTIDIDDIVFEKNKFKIYEIDQYNKGLLLSIFIILALIAIVFAIKYMKKNKEIK